ncbi:MAG: hypothetical protein DHS80DRAFT_12830 [Piptocephalis tieghemiana]|nr:MAG: hypothetical protein DHS80DRAFT_12830 [Piptocephalis tieghemiana]
MSDKPKDGHGDPTWGLPSWAITPGTHIFPYNRVIVREEEPSTLIAFSLSAKARKRRQQAVKMRLRQEELAAEEGLGRSLTSPIKLHTQPRPSPHLKYKVTEKDWRFTCTIYYARAFHALRARCGVDGWYATALEGCERWVPEGGKSSSHFYRTRDGRLILKQMVTRWTLTEKEALLDFAPSYLEYMLQAGGPTALAKIFGFYSLKYKNVASGKTMRMDVLVMEHLFHHTPTHTLTRTFDLKGIPTRWNVPGSTPRPEGTTPVLWDGDWLEGRNESTLLLHAHCKPILVDAIARDTAFLARSNIMDYSLVVGVDPTRRELVVGLIDFIGAFTWYKKIESHGKRGAATGLWVLGASGKGVTDPASSVSVLPPQQYAERFRKAMENYFQSVPGRNLI